MIKFLLYSIIYYLINIIFIKYNFLIDKLNISNHKRKISSNLVTPLSGGVIFILIFPFIDLNQNYFLLFAIISFYVLGLMSDINFISSPKVRITLQTLSILSFLILDDLSVKSLSINMLDNLLEFRIINIFFLLICLLVLVNGFNFLDGVNTLVIGNFIICLFSILYLSTKNGLILDFIIIENLLIIFSVIYLFNFFGKSFLGDSGTYAISFLVGVLFINFAYENYLSVSPYFVGSILWYPAIENLFSVLRRLSSRDKISNADNRHLHHFLYAFIKKNFLLKKSLFINTFTGVIINIYLIISALTSTIYFNQTKILLLIITINFIIYFVIYFLLLKKSR